MEPSPAEVDNIPQTDQKQQVLEAELRSLRAQLDWMTARKAWRLVERADRIIFWARHFSPVKRLLSMAGAVKRIPRRLRSTAAAGWRGGKCGK